MSISSLWPIYGVTGQRSLTGAHCVKGSSSMAALRVLAFSGHLQRCLVNAEECKSSAQRHEREMNIRGKYYDTYTRQNTCRVAVVWCSESFAGDR